MAIAQRYVNKELFGLFLLIMGFLLLVVVGGRFLGYLEEASLGSLSGTLAVMFIVYRLPEFLQIVAPIAMFFAVLLTFGRLYAESEMVIFHASGVGIRQVGSWLCWPVLGVSLFVASLSLYLTPKCSHLLDELLTEQRKISTFDLINPGNFLTLKQGDYTIYSEGVSADDGVLSNIFIFEKTRIKDEIAFWAERGEIVVNEEAKTRFLRLQKGFRYQGNPGQADYQVIEFESYDQEITFGETESRRFDVAGKDFFRLGDSPEEAGEFHWRVGLPIFSVLSGFLALGLSRTKSRQGRYGKVVQGALSVFSYYLLLLFNHNAIVEGSIPAYLGLWCVHMPFAFFAFYLCRQIDSPRKV